MIRFRLAVCAETVVRDAETNSVSIVNLIEEVSSPGFPVLLPRMSAVFVLERDAGDPEEVPAEVHMTLNESTILRSAIKVEFKGKLRTRAFITAGPIPFEREGKLRVQLTLISGESDGWEVPVTKVEEGAVKGVVKVDLRKK